MSPEHLSFATLSPPLILFGLGAVLASAVWLVIGETRRTPGAPASASAMGQQTDMRWIWLLSGIVVVGALFRLTGLDAKGISHPEVYIPGINLPPGLSEPPPRHELVETFNWHWHSEPHPFGYYMAMWAWTKVFGASIISIRLPEAILGVLSIPLIYKVGVLAYDRRVGLTAAALLALHGSHIFWSQAARMYGPGAFFGLAATWALLEMNRRDRPSLKWEVAYVLAILSCAMTVEFSWLLLFTHFAWTAFHHRGAWTRPPRAAFIQAVAMIVSTPMLSQAIIGARGGAAAPPNLDFVINYLSFGLLFQHGSYDEVGMAVPLFARAGMALAGLALMALGLWATARQSDQHGAPDHESPDVWHLAPLAVGSCALMLGIAADSTVRRAGLAVASALPLAAIAAPWVAAAVRPMIRSASSWADDALERMSGLAGLVPMLAIGPVSVLLLASFRVELIAERAFNIFIPYVLVLVAAGVVAIARTRVRAAVVYTALLATFIVSAVGLRQVPISPRDYRGLAQAMETQFQADDLVFIRPKDWSHTPLLYYLEPKRLVGSHYADALAASPHSDVWVVLMLQQGPTPEMAAALRRYRRTGGVEAQRIWAHRYSPVAEPPQRSATTDRASSP